MRIAHFSPTTVQFAQANSFTNYSPNEKQMICDTHTHTVSIQTNPHHRTHNPHPGPINSWLSFSSEVQKRILDTRRQQDTRAFVYLSQQEEQRLAQSESLEDEEVVHGRHGQHRHPLLLPQHAGRRAPQAPQHPQPAAANRAAATPLGLGGPRGAPAESTMSRVAKKRQQEKQRGADVRPPHHARNRLGVHRVSGEQEARQQAPRSSAQQGATEGGEEGGDQAVQQHVGQVVTPGVQAVEGVVEAEGERAERAEGLVAAAVREQGAPEVIVQDVGPRRLRKEVLVGLDGSAGRRTDKISLTLTFLPSFSSSFG